MDIVVIKIADNLPSSVIVMDESFSNSFESVVPIGGRGRACLQSFQGFGGHSGVKFSNWTGADCALVLP